MLSRRVPYAVRMHAALTGYFVGSVTRRVRHGPEPPPLSSRRSGPILGGPA
jgi:hypothetical protein